MSYVTGTATDVADLLSKLDAFLTLGHALDPAYTGAGTGKITSLAGTPASVLEAITVTFSGAANFTVAGSVSGALGAGTVGAPFACAVCAFTIAAGSTPWANGDTIAFLMTAPWTRKRYSTVANDATQYSIWQAPGNDGVNGCFAGCQRFSDVTGDYDNLRLIGATGYNAGQPSDTYTNQPGYCAGPILPLMRVGAMPYWFVASGRRVAIVVKCSTVYASAYLGLLTPYVNPTQMPYPLVIGGSMAWGAAPAANSGNWRWSYQGNEHSAYPLAFGAGADASVTLRMRTIAGLWRGFCVSAGANIGTVWPAYGWGNDARPQVDGGYWQLPVVLSDDLPSIYGELEGVTCVTGYGNAVENTITDASTRLDYLVVQNVYRNTQSSFYALKLA